MNLFWLVAIGTTFVAGASWYLYREHVQDDDELVEKPSIAKPACGQEAVLLAQFLAPFITVICALCADRVDTLAWVFLRIYTPGAPGLWASGLLGLSAFGLFAAAKRTLSTNYSPLYKSKVPAGLITTGPYGVIRHPIYTANMTLLAAATLMTGSLWNGAILIILWITYTKAACLEETALNKAFCSYADYMGRTGKFLPLLPTWMYTGVIKFITKVGATSLQAKPLVSDTDLASFQKKFETQSGAKVSLKYLRNAIVMGYITKDGQMAAGYVVNAALPLRYFSFLPELERYQLPGEPGEEDFVEITCIWINKHLTRYCDRGVVYLDSVEVAKCKSDKPFILGGSNVPRVREQQMHAFTTPLRSFVSVVHYPPCPYWIYYGSPDATLIRMCRTMLSVVFCDIAAVCGVNTNHLAFSYKRKYKTPANGTATIQ